MHGENEDKREEEGHTIQAHHSQGEDECVCGWKEKGDSCIIVLVRKEQAQTAFTVEQDR